MAKNSAPSITYKTPLDEVLGILGTDGERGLDSGEAKRRGRPGGNRIYDESRTSLLRYAGYCSFDLCLLLMLLTAVTASFFGEGDNCRIVIPILLVSIVIRTAAYIAARRYIESAMTAPAVMPSVTVRRDGENRRCDARGLVRGDLVFLRAGDIVPADCRLIFSRGLVVFEEQATGVPGVVRKNAGLISRANTVYAGSSVIAGECSGVVVYTGDETLLVRTRGYFSPQRGRMKLSRMLDTYSRKWGAVMAALAFFVTVLDLFFGGRGIYEVFFLGLSLAVAAMCEYYSALGDVAVAFGMHALAKRTGAALRGVQSVEAAANIDTLIVPADGVIVRDGVECRAVYYNGAIGEIENDGAPDTPGALFDWAVAADGGEDGKGSDVTGALREYIKIAGAGSVPDGMREIYSSAPEDGLPFDTRLYAIEDGFMSVSCGDAAAIVGACAFVGKDGERFPMTDELRAGILGFVAHHERRGAVAAAISRKRTPFSSRERMMFTQTDMELYEIFILYKPLAEGTEDAVASCAGAGIRGRT